MVLPKSSLRGSFCELDSIVQDLPMIVRSSALPPPGRPCGKDQGKTCPGCAPVCGAAANKAETTAVYQIPQMDSAQWPPCADEQLVGRISESRCAASKYGNSIISPEETPMDQVTRERTQKCYRRDSMRVFGDIEITLSR